MNALFHLWLIPLAPFAGFLINGILGRRLPKWLVTTVALLAPLAAFGVVLVAALGFFGIGKGFAPVIASLPFTQTCPHPWIDIGALHVDFSFVLDQLSLVMLLVAVALLAAPIGSARRRTSAHAGRGGARGWRWP